MHQHKKHDFFSVVLPAAQAKLVKIHNNDIYILYDMRRKKLYRRTWVVCEKREGRVDAHPKS